MHPSWLMSPGRGQVTFLCCATSREVRPYLHTSAFQLLEVSSQLRECVTRYVLMSYERTGDAKAGFFAKTWRSLGAQICQGIPRPTRKVSHK